MRFYWGENKRCRGRREENPLDSHFFFLFSQENMPALGYWKLVFHPLLSFSRIPIVNISAFPHFCGNSVGKNPLSLVEITSRWGHVLALGFGLHPQWRQHRHRRLEWPRLKREKQTNKKKNQKKNQQSTDKVSHQCAAAFSLKHQCRDIIHTVCFGLTVNDVTVLTCFFSTSLALLADPGSLERTGAVACVRCRRDDQLTLVWCGFHCS